MPIKPITTPTTIPIASLIVGFTMLLATLLSIWMKPKYHKTTTYSSVAFLEKNIPASLPHWKIEASGTENQMKNIQPTYGSLYDEILSRTYSNEQNHRILLLIAYGNRQTHELKAHRQEICYTAQGFKIYNLITQTVRLAGRAVPVTRLYAVKGNREERVTYWFTMKDKVVLGRMARLFRQLKFAIAGVVPDGFLFRVSSINQNESEALRDQTEFLNELMSVMDEGTITRLIGVK